MLPPNRQPTRMRAANLLISLKIFNSRTRMTAVVGKSARIPRTRYEGVASCSRNSFAATASPRRRSLPPARLPRTAAAVHLAGTRHLSALSRPLALPRVRAAQSGWEAAFGAHRPAHADPAASVRTRGRGLLHPLKEGRRGQADAAAPERPFSSAFVPRSPAAARTPF